MASPEPGGPVGAPSPPAASPPATQAAQSQGMRPLDAVAAGRVQRRLDAAPTPPWLHTEVARRMAERLPIIRLQPAHIADWHAFRGASGALLAKTYPSARITAVEATDARRAATTVQRTPPRLSLARWRGRGPAPACLESALPPGQVELLWANMALHFAVDHVATMRQWHRALAADGFLMFSTLGPGSLALLRELYAAGGWGAPFAPFVDLHDSGDMLVEAGFADPVMDQELLTLTWPSAEALLAELRTLGGNANVARHAGLRTPRWRRQLERALQHKADGTGRIALVFEVVYGHAFKPLPRPRLAAETALPLADMRALIKAGRKPR